MPTGYTAPLHAGKDITFEQFVLRCSRGMGAAVTQRDESLDSTIRKREPSDYHRKALDKAVKRLDEALAMTVEQAEVLAEESYAARLREHEKSMAKRAAMQERYEAMLAKVRNWTPPTTDHEGLKTFMVEQLEESIEFDCVGFGKYKPRRKTAKEYMQDELQNAKDNIEYYTEQMYKEHERVREQNEWVQALADDLGVEVD